MTDTKLLRVSNVAIGYDSSNATTAVSIVRVSDRLVSPEGAMVEPVPVLGQNQPATVAQRGRYWEVELELDSDNIDMFRTQDVVSGAGSGQAWEESSDNNAIDYFMINFEDTAGNTVSHLYESDRVYLAYARGRVSNEKGVDRQSTVYRLFCIGNRTVGSTAITAKGGTDEQYTGVQKIAVAGTDVNNVLWYEWEFVGQDGGEILSPRITPNTYEAVGVTEWGRRRRCVTHPVRLCQVFYPLPPG
jgi:hypothetical protein